MNRHMVFGQFAASLQFFLYGRRHCTAHGWKRHSAHYDVSALEKVDLSGRVYVVTGANAGLGRCLSEFLANSGATLYMVCRNAERAEKAREEIVAQMSPERCNKVHTLIADCGLASDVRRLARELAERETAVDGLVCNAGAITHERTLTKEGHEMTFATHFLHGSYLLTQLMMPLLRKAAAPRVVFVSSAGMYNTKFPAWEIATNEQGKYNKELAYCFAKRGQVLLAERWAKQHPEIAFVSCHPGWVDTPGVDAWLGKNKRALQPMRTLWQGVEGIAWLCACPRAELEPGALYLDRSPRTKHLAGPFFTEGSFTKNSEAQVDVMMEKLASSVAES